MRTCRLASPRLASPRLASPCRAVVARTRSCSASASRCCSGGAAAKSHPHPFAPRRLAKLRPPVGTDDEPLGRHAGAGAQSVILEAQRLEHMADGAMLRMADP